MKRELLCIENGMVKKADSTVINGLFLRISEGETAGIVFQDIMERRLFVDMMKGQTPLLGGRAYWREEKTDAPALEKRLERTVAVIERNSKLIRSISVPENIFLFSGRSLFVRQKQYKEAYDRLREKYKILPEGPRRVRDLTPKEKVIIELLKACVEEKRIILFDDLSSFLQKSEADEIFMLLRRLPEQMSFLFMLGLEDTGVGWMDHITIVENGRTAAVIGPDRDKLHRILYKMVNKRPEGKTVPVQLKHQEEESESAVLEFKNVTTGYMKDVSFYLVPGEILKLCFLDEKSREEFVGLLQGAVLPEKGCIFLEGRLYRAGNVRGAIQKGVCFVEEVPYKSMLFNNMTAVENLSIPLHDKVSFFWGRRRYKRSVEAFAGGCGGKLWGRRKLKDLKASTLQQIAYMKWLLYAPKVVVCVNPFLELDINMREKTLEMLDAYRKMGIAVIVLTSNLYTVNKIEGETLFLHHGRLIDEEEAYRELYGNGGM